MNTKIKLLKVTLVIFTLVLITSRAESASLSVNFGDLFSKIKTGLVAGSNMVGLPKVANYSTTMLDGLTSAVGSSGLSVGVGEKHTEASLE